MASRQVTVNVNLQASGNLAQAAGAAAAQAAKLNQAAKGAQQAAAQAAGPNPSGAAGVPVPGAQLWTPQAAAALARQRQVPAARFWTPQDTLGASTAKRIADAEQHLAFMRSGPGRQATMRALSAEQELAHEQERLSLLARTGSGPLGAIQRFAERIEPLTRGAGIAGAAGLASIYGGIASVSPEASSQITNSFKMIANEIGIATIPAAVRFTGVLQSVSRWIRTVNEGTNGWAGSLAFVGATALTGVGALGLAGRAFASTTSGLRSLGLLAEVGAPVAGQVLARGGAGAATTGVAGTAGGAAAGGMGLAIPAAGALVGGGLGYYAEREQQAREARGEQRSRWTDIWTSLLMPGVPYEVGRWLGRSEASAAPPANVSDLHPQSYGSALELYQAMSMQAQQTPGDLAAQENRAMAEFIQALNANTAALNAAGGPGGATWSAPPASENG